jgi:hypothetical protein
VGVTYDENSYRCGCPTLAACRKKPISSLSPALGFGLKPIGWRPFKLDGTCWWAHKKGIMYAVRAFRVAGTHPALYGDGAAAKDCVRLLMQACRLKPEIEILVPKFQLEQHHENSALPGEIYASKSRANFSGVNYVQNNEETT